MCLSPCMMAHQHTYVCTHSSSTWVATCIFQVQSVCFNTARSFVKCTMSYTIRHVSSWGTITTCLFQVYRVYFNPSCSFVSCTMSYTVIHVSLRDAITSVCIGWYVFSRYYVSISMSHVPLSSVPWCHIQSDTLHPSSSDAFSQQIRHTIHCSCEEHILFCHVLLSIRHVTSIFLRCLFTEDTARTLQCRALVIHTFFCHVLLSIAHVYIHLLPMLLHRGYGLRLCATI